MTTKTENWVQVLDVAELDGADMIGIEVDDRHIAVYRVEDKYYATANVCTHAFALLSDGWLDGEVIECPLHGGCFNVCTGKAIKEPVEKDLETFDVRVVDGMIEIFLPNVSSDPEA